MGKKRKKKTYTTPKKIKNVHVNEPLRTLKNFKVNDGKVERLRDKCNKCNYGKYDSLNISSKGSMYPGTSTFNYRYSYYNNPAVSMNANPMFYVGQRVNLIRGTLTQNIAFGYEENEIDKEKLDFAVNTAQLRSLVDSFDEGLDKIVIDNGLNFSGGQIQRIGIARALYNNPEILVFDEPTSAIDNKLKGSFLRDIHNISKAKTIIMVTHNRLDLKDCNKIIELDKYE